ncbi:MAG: penicillin-binding protein activator [Stellaceae bacterium]
MPRWYFASPMIVLVVAALASCVPPPMVAAPVIAPQPPYGQPLPPQTPPPPPPVAAGPAKVALLVPLSGPNAGLGQAILNAAQLALFETGGDRLTLVPRDTRGTPGGAADAARAALADGVSLILGPLLAAEVEAVTPIARDAHVDVIAFSTVTDLAGGNTFLMGFLPGQEVVREVAYARQRGIARFAALAPDTAYGHLMVDTLRQSVPSTDGRVAQVAFYGAGGGDASVAIQRLLPGSVGPPSPTAQGPTAPGSAAPGSVPPAPDQTAPAPATPANFDALLLPDGGDRLKAIARELVAAGLDTKAARLLGSGLWDVPDIGDEPALDGGWFAASPPDARRDFEQRYRATYGREPPRLASLGYDAAALAAVLARGQGGPPFSRDAILNPSGFTGVDGLFRFTPQGLVQRELAVLEVEPQGNVVVSPAPQNFRDLGY